MIIRFEHLPNELLLEIFEYISVRDLYYTFSVLNQRFKHLVFSLKYLSMMIYRNDEVLFKLFADKIIHLTVCNMFEPIKLKQFPNLRSLTIHRPSDNQFQEIQYELMPYLTYLFISCSCNRLNSTELILNIFSNRFPSLRSIDLGLIVAPEFSQWSCVPSLRTIRIICYELILFHRILLACPSLKRLEIEIENAIRTIDLPKVKLNHGLKHLTLLDRYRLLTFEMLDKMFSYIPNIRQLVFQGYSQGPFLLLIQMLCEHFKHLNQFDCIVTESPNNWEENNLNNIHQMNPCFHRIQYTIDSHGYKTFTTYKSHQDFFGYYNNQ